MLESPWGSLNTLKVEELQRESGGGEEPAATVVELRVTLNVCSSWNRAVPTHRRGGTPCETVLPAELEGGPGLLGSVAKHLPRAGELESIWEQGQTKNKREESKLSTCAQWKHNNTEMWQRNTKQVRNRP